MPEPIIGFVVEDIGGVYESRLWAGVREQAAARHLRVLCFPGGHFRNTQYNPFERQRNDIYRYLTTTGLEGLIVAGSIGNGVERETVAEWVQGLGDLPLVGVTPALGDYPAVETDDYAGMKALMEHLLTAHGYHTPAFIQGPMDNAEASRRFQAYVDALGDAGIPYEPSRVFPGDFSRTAGAAAARQLLRDRRGIDVLVGSNDSTALGAMHVLQDAGVCVPDDIAVAGYDNVGAASFATPGLTTVHQPFEAVGRHAVDLLRSVRHGAPRPRKPVTPRLVIRASCGCRSSAPSLPARPPSVSNRVGAQDIVTAFARLCDELACTETDALLTEFAEACERALDTGDSADALQACGALARKALQAGSDVYLWRRVITELYTATVRSRWMEVGTVRLLFELTGVVEDAARELDMRVRHVVQSRHEILHEVSRTLTSTFALGELTSQVRRQLPRLGIERAALVLSSSAMRENGTSELLTVFDTQHDLDEDISGGPFPSDRLLPEPVLESMLAAGGAVVLPLHFRDETLGHLVVDDRGADGRVCEALAALVASAYRGVRLVEHIRKQSSALEKANLSLRRMREKEHEYLRKIEDDLNLARRIQEGFLPSTFPRLPGWDFAAFFRPARGVAGDFYDVFEPAGKRVVCVIADVCGKGVGAALFMSLVRSLIRSYLERCEGTGEDLCGAAAHASDYIAQHHARGKTRTCMFATSFLLSLDPSSGECFYVNAGHVQPVLFGGTKASRLLEPTGPGLGLAHGMAFRCEQVSIAPGQNLFLYTDGVNEAKGPEGELFGKARLTNLLEVARVATAEEVNEEVERALAAYRNALPEDDDTTMLTISRGASPGTST